MAQSDSSTYRVIDLSSWTGGVRDHRRNPLAFPENCIADGENVDLTDRGLRTRKGWKSIAWFGAGSEIRALYQVRFPTNETKYLVAQVHTGVATASGGIPRRAYVSTVHNGKWWIWGGEGEGGVPPDGQVYRLDAFDFETGEWSQLAECNPVVNSGLMVGSGDKLYLLAFYGDIGYLRLYDIPSDTWTEGTGIDFIAIDEDPAIPNCVAAAGDWVYFWNAGWPCVVYTYRISTGQWQTSGAWEYPPSSGRYKATETSLIVGPYTGEGGPSYWGVYDPATNSWSTTTEDQQTTYSEHYSSIVDGISYEYGVEQYFGEDSGEIWMVVDGVEGPHHIVTADVPEAGPGFAPGAVNYGGRIYCFGGRAHTFDPEIIYVSGLMAVYDIQSGQWLHRYDGPFVVDTGDALWAAPDNLPADTVNFVKIFDLNAGAGCVSCAILNDRAVFTEGIANRPLVWGGCMAEDGSDWMYPKAVLASADGVNFFDVTAEVCDKDSDTVADIGGLNAWGFLAICCDMPKVSGFRVEMNSPNAGTGISTATEEVELDSLAKVYQQDLKGEIVRWIKDTEVQKTLAGAAVDLGGSPNMVKIPCAAHGFFAGDIIQVTGTTNYNGTYTLPVQTSGDANNFVIEHSYTAETFASPDEAHVVVGQTGGHFEGQAKTLAGAAVDLGGTPNKVKIPCTAHGFIAGEKITVRNTTNYDGVYLLPSQTSGDANNFVIESAFNVETFASPDEAGKRVVLQAAQPPYVNVLPQMTGDTAPAPNVASKDAVTWSGSAYAMFDRSDTLRLYTTVDPPHWVAIYLGTGNGFIANAWRWKSANFGGREPKRFKLQGWHNGDWVDLETSHESQDYVTLPLLTWSDWFPFTTNLNCEKYRMYIITCRGQYTGTEFNEIEISELQELPEATVVPGVLVAFAEGDIDLQDIGGTGESDGAVTLSEDHDTADVPGIYGLDVQDGALCVNRPLAEYVETFALDEDTTKKTLCGGMHYRVRIPASAITHNGEQVRLTLHAGHDTTYGAAIRHCAIAPVADKIGIPCTEHNFSEGDVVSISGTVNYDGIYTLGDQTGGDSDNFIITGLFVAETFGAGAKVTPITVGQRLTGEAIYQAAPAWYKLPNPIGATVGDTVHIEGTTYWNGDHQLTSPYGWVDGTGRYYEAFGNKPNARIFKLGADQEKSLTGGAAVDLGPAEGYVAGAIPTPLLFNGAAGIAIAVGEAAVTDFADFALDETKDYLVIIDCEWAVDTSTQRNVTLQNNVLSGATTYYYTSVSAADTPLRDSYDIADPKAGTVDTRRWRNVVNEFADTVVGVHSIEVKQQLTLPTGLYVATTTDAESLDISYITEFSGVDVTQSTPDNATIWHAVSLDYKQTFQVFLNNEWRTIVRNNGGTWQYLDATDTWQDATQNTRLQALHDALSIAENQMTAAQLEAITPEQWVDWGGIVLYETSNLDFAVGMQVDGPFWPSLSKYGVTYKGEGASVTEGWKAGAWDGGDGWTDGTNLFAQSGLITYDGADPFEADYSVLSEVPGFWYRIKMKGTSPGTSITRVRYRGPCQELANIGDGQPDIVLGFIFNDTDANVIRDFSTEVGDGSLTELSKADIPMECGDYLYVGYITRFNEIEITPYQHNNTRDANLLAEYWNGEAWAALAVKDGTLADEATLAKKGKVSWQVPAAWRAHIPPEAGFPRGYWIRLAVSASLSPDAAISSVRVYGVPEPIKKHRLAVAVRDRIALLSRPDAADQVDVSRGLEEYGFDGADSGSYRVGGMDGIYCACAAWNGLFVGKTESWHQLVGSTPADFGFQSIEAARHVPINSGCIVKAPVDFGDGDRYGLFFLNTYGAFVASGLHVDSLWNTARGQLLSDSVKWWISADHPRLDLHHLDLACGVYWPAANWIVWAVPMIVAADQTEQPANNRLIVYDLTFRAWLPPFTISLASMTTAYHDNPHAPGRLGPVGLYGGDDLGRILRLFDSAQTTDGDEAIPAWIETGWHAFGSPEYGKILRMLTLYGNAAGSEVKVEAFSDGEDSVPYTLLFKHLENPAGRSFAEEQLPQNLAGRFFKFRITINGPAEIYGLRIGTSLIRDWGAM